MHGCTIHGRLSQMLWLNKKKKGKTRKNKRTASLSTIQTGTINTFRERDGITNDSEILMQPEIAIASSSIEINTISTFGERYDTTNDYEILMQSEIAIASSLNEIVEVEIAQTN